MFKIIKRNFKFKDLDIIVTSYNKIFKEENFKLSKYYLDLTDENTSFLRNSN